jgi:hypothetical protein
MLPLRSNNPLAPAAYNGLSSIGPNFEDGGFCKQSPTFTIATAYGTILNTQTLLDKDADFLVTAIYNTSGNTEFAFRIADQNGYYLMDNFLSSYVFLNSQNVGVPFILPIPMRFPRGSSILVDFTDQSGATNTTYSLLFEGIKHFIY